MGRPLLTLIILFALCAGPGFAAAAELADPQQKLQRLKQGVAEQRLRVESAKKQEKSLLDELARLEKQVKEERRLLADLRQALSEQEAQLEEQRTAMMEAEATREEARPHIEKRMAAYSRMGSLGVLNVVFAAETLPELLSFQESFAAILRHDRETTRQYREKLVQLREAEQRLAAEKERLLEAMRLVEEQEAALIQARRERNELLRRVKTEKGLYLQALKEIEQAAKELTTAIGRLKPESAPADTLASALPKKRKPGAPDSFAAHQGVLPPPVAGAVITRFGKNRHRQFEVTAVSSGIDIKTEPGAEVRAIYHGAVVYAGIMRGYGNLLIIDHGDQYYSLVSRLAELFKKEGDKVRQGETLGLMNDQPAPGDEGLHFEIRRGTEAVDPLRWINNAGLKINTP